MRPLESEFLMTLEIELETTHVIGETPAGTRRIDIFRGGRFEGPRLRGRIAAGGSDMILRRADGAMQPDVRLTLETDDGAFIQVTYRGVRHGPDEVMQRIAAGEDVDASEYYLRNTPYFETGSADYDWLNRIVAVGLGRRAPHAAVYDVYEIL
ncbi:MAG: DUF3237 domain-containing protein [Alphaproteobacteria bacterium]|jgi:hypothetical protein|nr:DUF3237 domain-containing protein [Alphaproteobacteria bacterium]